MANVTKFLADKQTDNKQTDRPVTICLNLSMQGIKISVTQALKSAHGWVEKMVRKWVKIIIFFFFYNALLFVYSAIKGLYSDDFSKTSDNAAQV